MTKITLIQNPNFKEFWNLLNGNEKQDEIAGKKKAVRIALKLAKQINEERITMATEHSSKLIEVHA